MIENLDLKQMALRGLAIAGLATVSGCVAPQETVVRTDSTPNPHTIVVQGPNYKLTQVSKQGIEIWGWSGGGGADYYARLRGLRDLNERCELISWADAGLSNSNATTSVTTKEDFCLLKFQR